MSIWEDMWPSYFAASILKWVVFVLWSHDPASSFLRKYLTPTKLKNIWLTLFCFRVHDVGIFVVPDFVFVHFYNPPISLIFENPCLDHFVVDIVDTGHTFHSNHFPVAEIWSENRTNCLLSVLEKTKIILPHELVFESQDCRVKRFILVYCSIDDRILYELFCRNLS